jgi:DNA (cytosine-5)-methyltransferase 1
VRSDSPSMLTVGSLFAGIGGFDLGFERAGFEIRWQVEIDPFARAVLAKHWPDVRRYEDVRSVHHYASCQFRPEFDGPCDDHVEEVDVLCGGFPCQDISPAGPRVGIDGARSGLWRDFARLVGELRPRYVVVENSAALLVRGMGRVVGDLAALGYDAEWDVVSACAVGAPHTRERVFLVAYPAGRRTGQLRWFWSKEERQAAGNLHWQSQTEPPGPRVVDGIPDRMDRLAAAGNAIIPQIAEWIAERINEAEGLT